jgi:hypothetical protein
MSLNTPHKVTRSEAQISIILYTLEDYRSKGNTSNDPDLPREIDNIFEELEGTIDKHYNKIEAAKKKQPKFMFLENVKHILKVGDGEVIEYIKNKIESIGYHFLYILYKLFLY